MTAIADINSGIPGNPKARPMSGGPETLPSAKARKSPRPPFKQAAEECNAISVDEFFDQLDERIKCRFDA
jgi:hypothetical protein